MVKSMGQRILATPSPFARAHCNYVQEVGSLTSIEPHISSRKGLKSYLFFLVLSGRGTFYYDHIPYKLRQGDCVWADCRLPYAHESSQDAPWELKWVHFYGQDISCFYEAFWERENSVVFTPYDPGSFNETLSALFFLYKDDAAEKEILSHKYLTDIIAGCLAEHTEAPGKTDATLEKLSAARDYMKEHFQEDISLDKLASLCYLSKYHLARAYKQTFGVTPGNDLTGIRISKAKSLLRFTTETIGNIAELCGYPDANYFTKVFKKWEGLTPLEYRRKW